MAVTRYEKVLIMGARARHLIEGAPRASAGAINPKDKEIMVALREYEEGKIDVEAHREQIVKGMRMFEREKHMAALDMRGLRDKSDRNAKSLASLDLDMIRLFEDVSGYHNQEAGVIVASESNDNVELAGEDIASFMRAESNVPGAREDSAIARMQLEESINEDEFKEENEDYDISSDLEAGKDSDDEHYDFADNDEDALDGSEESECEDIRDDNKKLVHAPTILEKFEDYEED